MRKGSFVPNSHGIAVRVWCASCRYKDLTRAVSLRRCAKHHRNVSAGDVCNDWQMSEQLQLAGKSQGAVRDKDTKEVVIGEELDFRPFDQEW